VPKGSWCLLFVGEAACLWAMPLCPKGKRGHDGSDVRAYPKSGESYKKTDPERTCQRLLEDEVPSALAPGDEEEAAEAAKVPPPAEGHTELERAVETEVPEGDQAELDEVGGSASADAKTAAADVGAEDRFSVCVVGAGAIGCHIAYVLHKAGNDVTLVARGENLKTLQSEGLRMRICGEDVPPVKIKATDKPDQVGQVDYVFLTMKVSGYDSSVAEMIRPMIGDQTTILPPTTTIPYWWFYKWQGKLQNCRLSKVDPCGMLWDLMPPEKVVGFTMWLSAVQLGPGRVELRHVQRGYPLGELDGSKSRRVERLAAAFERGSIPSPRVPCIRSEIFIKSLNSLAFNVVALLGDASNGTIADAPEAVEVLHRVMKECEVLAETLGLTIGQNAESRIKQTLSARMHTMSMLHDLRIGKSLELRPLWTSFEDLASHLDIDLPLTRGLVGVALLREASERKRRAEASAGS